MHFAYVILLARMYRHASLRHACRFPGLAVEPANEEVVSKRTYSRKVHEHDEASKRLLRRLNINPYTCW